MTRPNHAHADPPPLPVVQFEKVEDSDLNEPAGVHDQQARSYGYNDFSPFQRPSYYIRYIEPLDVDLINQVEYDMDDQDQEWLEAVNSERKKEQLDKVTYEVFEIIMDRLEKEWFSLTKAAPKPEASMPSEDSTCAICDDAEGENSNAIVFCDGCNLAVHQDCYGVPYIPEGQWLCRKCTVSPENPVSCILCPEEGGAFKQTTSGEWVHLLCAIWIPETRVANEVFMEPVTDVEKISKQRWKLKCSICKVHEGACIQCAKASCFLAFHPTCARNEKFLMPMKSVHGVEPGPLTCYCEKHLPKEQLDARAVALAKASTEPGLKQQPKSARAYAKTYKPGPPLVPAIIVNNILQYINKVTIRKKPEFVHLVCKYWSLKREARRGAPLLKRLHLEPWATSSSGRNQPDEEKEMKLEQLKLLRNDLQRVRDLADLTRKREGRQFRQAEVVFDFINRALFGHEPAFRSAFEKITALDRQNYFRSPVLKSEVPDYYDVIEKPMCWQIVEAKLDHHEYWDVRSFRDDIELVLSNALAYNKPGTPYHRQALNIQNKIAPILQELDLLAFKHVEISAEATEDLVGLSVGDLEPPLDVLDMLASEDVVKSDTDLITGKEPIMSLLNFELPQFKPPPTPPPPPPPKPTARELMAIRKRKAQESRDRYKEKKKREKEEAKKKEEEAATASAAATAVINGEGLLEGEATSMSANLLNRLAEIPTTFSPRKTRHSYVEDADLSAALLESMKDVAPETISWGNAGSIMDPETASLRSPTAQQASELMASVSDDGTVGTLESDSSRKKRRTPQSQLGQALPAIVSDVSNRDSFKNFETGWILPENAKRRVRTSMDRAVPLPPAKKARKDDGSSRLSVVASEPDSRAPPTSRSRSQSEMQSPLATAAQLVAAIHDSFSPLSDVTMEETSAPLQALDSASRAPEAILIQGASSTDTSTPATQPPSAFIEGPSVKPPSRRVPLFEQDLVLDASLFGTRRDRKGKPRAPSPSPVDLLPNDELPAPVIIHEADGSVVLEEIDSPAVRRRKNMERKAQKSREIASTSSSHPLSRPPTTNLDGSESERAVSAAIEIGDDEELSELSELSDFEDEKGADDEVQQQLTTTVEQHLEETRLDDASGINGQDMDAPMKIEDRTDSFLPKVTENALKEKLRSPILDFRQNSLSTPQNTDTSIAPLAVPHASTLSSSSVPQPVPSTLDSIVGQPKKPQSLPSLAHTTTSAEGQRLSDDHEIAQIMILLADSSRDPTRNASHRRASVSVLPEASASSVERYMVEQHPSSSSNETRRTVSGPPMQSISAPPTRSVQGHLSPEHAMYSGLADVPSLTAIEDSTSRGAESVAGPSRAQDEDLSVDADSDGKVRPGTIVWARMESGPRWPAIVVDEQDPEIPTSVRQTKKDNTNLIRFLEEKPSWHYMTLPKLKLLGVSERFDSECLAIKTASVRKKFSKRELSEAYQKAMSLLSG